MAHVDDDMDRSSDPDSVRGSSLIGLLQGLSFMRSLAETAIMVYVHRELLTTASTMASQHGCPCASHYEWTERLNEVWLND